MRCYIVAFQGKELDTRKKVRELLKKQPGYCPINISCWAVLSESKAKDIRNQIAEVLQPGDRVFVVRSGTEGAWRNIIGGSQSSEWLKRNL